MKKNRYSLRVSMAALLFALIFSSFTSTAMAWGHEGHKIVAEVAEHYLNATAKEKITRLLASIDKRSIAEIASWADTYRRTHPETGPWHYVDIPLDATKYDSSKYCKNGDCVVSAINKFEEELANTHLSEEQRAIALKFVVHFIGDVHQPLHSSDNDDRGGNDVKVDFFGQQTNLHRVWDYGILEKTGMDAEQYTSYLIQKYHPTAADLTKLETGDAVSWAMQSHDEAVKVAYGDKPSDNKLGETYYKECLPVVDQQLFDAGVRLAGVLNKILG